MEPINYEPLLREISSSLSRVANVLERIAQANDISLDAEQQAAQMSEKDLVRNDDLTPLQEEWLATIEIMEEQGIPVPAEAYKLIGLDPPRREDEPTTEEMERPQPGAEDADDEGIVSSKVDD
jgi:hypothetical protein